MRQDHALRGHPSLNELFDTETTTPETKRSKRSKHPPPFSIRFNEEERAYLDKQAGSQPLAAYIRQVLFEGADFSKKNLRRPKQKLGQPSVDHRVLAEALGNLGQSRLASNMNQIAKAANVGALPVTQDLERELHEACSVIRNMRHLLIEALGIKAEDGA